MLPEAQPTLCFGFEGGLVAPTPFANIDIII